MNNKLLTRGMLNVLSANLINLIFNLLTNFLLPKHLSVDTYASIKTYQLYCVYVGILHLGFVDGMFLKYGGASLNKIRANGLGNNLSTMRLFQFMVLVPMLFWGIIQKDITWIAFAMSVVPINMVQYFKFLYQASGEFKLYGRLMNLTTGSTFLSNMFLLFILITDTIGYYLMAYVIVNVIIWIILEIQFRKTCKYKFKFIFFSITEFCETVKEGFLLMIGNFTSSFLVSMDRWFVKILMLITDFAQYSFAVSVESVLNVAITPITVTLYNFFCINKDDITLLKCRNYVCMFSSFIVIAAFPAKFILEIYLSEYLSSVDVIFYLFAAQILYVNIKAIYVNLYKVKLMQKRYFAKLCIVCVCGFALNIFLYCLMYTKESFALGTLLAAVIWFFLSTVDFPEIKFQVIHYFYIFFNIAIFLICGKLFMSILGFIIYIVSYVIISLVVFKGEFLKLFFEGINRFQIYRK